MATASRRETRWAVTASVAAHIGVVAVLLLQHPTLFIPDEPSGPPQPIIPILIVPHTMILEGGRSPKPAPIQLHRRPQRDTPEAAPIAPVVVAPAKPAEAPAQAPVAVAPKEAPQAPAPPDAVRNILRTTLGCTDVRLSRDERAGCQERLGRGSHDAPYFSQPMAADKRAGFDEVGAAKIAKRAALQRPVSAQTTISDQSSYDGEPDVATNAVAAPVFKDSKRAAKWLGRLPP